jgi:hypothetical protein
MKKFLLFKFLQNILKLSKVIKFGASSRVVDFAAISAAPQLICRAATSKQEKWYAVVNFVGRFAETASEMEEGLPVDVQPSEWSDDERMGFLMSAFKDRALNPRSWDAKMVFWRTLVHDLCVGRQLLVVDETSLKRRFLRQRSVPACLGPVLDALFRSVPINQKCPARATLRNFMCVSEQGQAAGGAGRNAQVRLQRRVVGLVAAGQVHRGARLLRRLQSVDGARLQRRVRRLRTLADAAAGARGGAQSSPTPPPPPPLD